MSLEFLIFIQLAGILTAGIWASIRFLGNNQEPGMRIVRPLLAVVAFGLLATFVGRFVYLGGIEAIFSQSADLRIVCYKSMLAGIMLGSIFIGLFPILWELFRRLRPERRE